MIILLIIFLIIVYLMINRIMAMPTEDDGEAPINKKSKNISLPARRLERFLYL